MPRKAKQPEGFSSLENGPHAFEMQRLVVSSIESFFKDKSYFCGGKIPNSELSSSNSIKTVLRFKNDDHTFEYIHTKCLRKIPRPKHIVSKSIPWTVQFLISLLEDMKGKKLPKEFQPGLVLLYFKFCKGLPIPQPPAL